LSWRRRRTIDDFPTEEAPTTITFAPGLHGRADMPTIKLPKPPPVAGEFPKRRAELAEEIKGRNRILRLRL
jgi:hypothetical protein